MTTLAILADLHGNLPALEAIIGDLSRQEIDAVIVAGDLVNWGPFSAQVIERVLAHGWTTIRGNHELIVLDYGTPRAPRAWDDLGAFPIPRWLHSQIPKRLRNQIALWPDTLVIRPADGPPLRIIHGSPRDHAEPIYPGVGEEHLTAILAGIAETTIVAAHTHLPMDEQIGPWHIINPGSAGMGLNGSFVARYTVLTSVGDGWRAQPREVAYDRAPLFAEFAHLRFEEECGVIGHLVVEEFRTARLRIAPFLRWRQATSSDAPFTRETLEQFWAIDPEHYMPSAHRLPAGVPSR
jgi:predicted phosphodiesterase